MRCGMRIIMRSPDVSIIITNYNYGKYLARCVRSCLAQKHTDVEIIVVDDCSTDNSLEVLSSYAKDVKIIINKKNVGVAASANVGIKAARSQFVIRVDADDFVNANMCYIMKHYLEANHDAFCVSCHPCAIAKRKSLENDWVTIIIFTT